MKSICALIVCLVLSCNSVQAQQITVLNAPSEQWRDELLASIKQVNDFLSPAFKPLPAQVRVVRTYLAPEYDLQRGVLFLDQAYIPVELYHEYAHRVLDAVLHTHSKAVRYFELRQEVGHQPLADRLAALDLELADDQIYLAELTALGYRDIAANLAAAIKQSQQLRQRLLSELPEDPRHRELYEHYRGATAAPSLYALLSPYHELFADTLAVLLTQRWNAIHMAQIRRLKMTDSVLSFVNVHPEISTEMFLSYRAFQTDRDLDTFASEPLLAKSPYTQFAPVRAQIRRMVEQAKHCSPDKLLHNLALAIAAEVETRLSSAVAYQLSLEEMNCRLILRLAPHGCR